MSVFLTKPRNSFFEKNLLEFTTTNQTYSSFIEALLIIVRGETINRCNSSTCNEPKLSLTLQQTKHEWTPVKDLFSQCYLFQ